MKRDSVDWRQLTSFSVIERPLARQFSRQKHTNFHILKAQSPQKRRNKKPRGGTMRKHLKCGKNSYQSFFMSCRDFWKIWVVIAPKNARSESFLVFLSGGFGGCSPGTKTGTRVHSDVPPERNPEIKGRFRKRVVLANVPLFRFSFRGNMRTYPRSGFRSWGTSECTLVPVFVLGEHPPNPPFWKTTLLATPDKSARKDSKRAFFGGITK